MTVKKNKRRVLSQTVILFMLLLTLPVSAAQKKNILHIRFQTVTIKPSTSDIVLNVFYKLEALRSPVFFHGFECRYVYDQTKIRPNTAFFDGTASANADIKGANDDVPADEYRVEVLSGSSLDTTNPILFQVRYSVKTGFTDSAMIIPTRFDPLSLTSGIDTVIIDNTPWDPTFGWIGFGLVFIDTTKPPPPKKISIDLWSDSTDVQSDSLKIVSLNVTSLDSANVKNGIFEFDVDTSAFDSVSVTKGALLANANLAIARDSTHIVASFSSTDSLTSKGELLRITLRGKHRTDTVCTGILNPKLTVLNADNRVSFVTYLLKGICVFGERKDTIIKGVVESGENRDSPMAIFPNPARSFIDFLMPSWHGVKKHLVVFDALGRRIFDEILDANLRWEVASVPVGLYTAIVMDFLALQEGRAGAEKRKILIIH